MRKLQKNHRRTQYSLVDFKTDNNMFNESGQDLTLEQKLKCKTVSDECLTG